MISSTLVYAPFDINISTTSFEWFSTAKWSGVEFLDFNFLNHLLIFLIENNKLFGWKKISIALIFAPFNNNISLISLDLYLAA